jgi:hypothetical protein
MSDNLRIALVWAMMGAGVLMGVNQCAHAPVHNPDGYEGSHP